MNSGAYSTSTRRKVAGNLDLASGRRGGSRLTAIILGKLTSNSVRPWVVVGEIVFVPLIAILLGLVLNPDDPLCTQASFPWPWFAPIILALRYGALAGLGASGILLGAWLLLNSGHYDTFPKLFFLGGLILVMLVGEFSSLWRARTRRAENTREYIDQRLEQLTRQYYLLRLSHDRLEQELISRPMSIRDALLTLRGLDGGAADSREGAPALLRLLAQYCQLESLSLHRVERDDVNTTPLASMGSTFTLDPNDPLIRQAIELRRLCHISQVDADSEAQTSCLIAAPLTDMDGEVFGLFVVKEMPFFALQEETLQTINLLLGYYTHGRSVRSAADPICREVPGCPPEFAFELLRLWNLQQTTGNGSLIVALQFLPRAVELGLPLQVLDMQRALDEVWLFGDSNRQILATLMPFGDTSTADGYVARLEGWAKKTSAQSLAELGIRSHVLAIDREPPVVVLGRLLGLAKG